jgi:hypothetical protein
MRHTRPDEPALVVRMGGKTERPMDRIPAYIRATMLSILVFAVAVAMVGSVRQVAATGPTAARPTPSARLSECDMGLSASVSAATVRTCDTITTTARIEPSSPFCLGGFRLIIVIPDRAPGALTIRIDGGRFLDLLEKFQEDYHHDTNRDFIVHVGVVRYTDKLGLVDVRMTENLNLARGALRTPKVGSLLAGGAILEAARAVVGLLRTTAGRSSTTQ